MINFIQNNKKIIIISLCILLFFALILLIVFTQNNKIFKQKEEQTNTGNLTQDSVVKKVQNDSIYAFEISNIKQQTSNIDEAVILGSLVKDSLLLQHAEKEGIIKLPSGFFSKDYKKRSTYLNDKSDYLIRLEAEYEKKATLIEGGIVTVFFYNQKFSSFPFDKADQKALELVTEARNKIISKEWSIQQAITELTKKTEIPQLDHNYLYNTGFEFSKTPVYRLFRDSVILNAIKSFKNGTEFQVGQIMRSPGEKNSFDRQYFVDHPDTNGYYYFLVIINKNDGYTASFNDWKSIVTNQSK